MQVTWAELGMGVAPLAAILVAAMVFAYLVLRWDDKR